MRYYAGKFGVSVRVVQDVFEALEIEGLLLRVKGVGTFTGSRSSTADAKPFLFITGGYLEMPQEMTYVGFAEEIARVGGKSLAIVDRLVPDIISRIKLDNIAAVCGHPWQTAHYDNGRQVPHVAMTQFSPPESDSVDYDNEHGGETAAQYLFDNGHRSTAFLPFIGDDGIESPWSIARAKGWRAFNEVNGLSTEGVVLPGFNGDRPSSGSTKAADAFLAQPSATAVVAANDALAYHFMHALLEIKLPFAMWPGIVAFDNLPNSAGQFLSTLSVSGLEMGRLQAQVLYDRYSGALTGHPIERKLKMRFIPRITGQPGWAHVVGPILPQVVESGCTAEFRTRRD